MMQLSFTEGHALKVAGQELVVSHNESFVELMRAEAKRISLERGAVSSDDLRVVADQKNLLPSHPNVWGSIWRDKRWEIVGRRKSAVPSTHAREIKIWRWRDDR